MVSELRDTAKIKHFKDLSELLRSVLRKQWLSSKDPYHHELQMLRQDISAHLKQLIHNKSSQQVVEELEKIQQVLQTK